MNGNTIHDVVTKLGVSNPGLAMLVEEGKINWDDPVQDYLPEFQLYDPYVTREMRVRDLVTHRSGLATFSGDHLVFGSVYTREDIVSRMRHLKPTSSFRSQFGYQNLMFLAAGMIVPRVTGETWDEAIESRIFEPLGMESSNTSVSDIDGKANASAGHWEVDGEMVAVELWNIDNGGPAGSINSSAADMAKWLLLQLAGGVAGEDTLYSMSSSKEMWRGQTILGDNRYGMGWFIGRHEGMQAITHSGGVVGAVSQVSLLPELNLGVVVLSNSMSGLPNALARWVFDAYSGAEETDHSHESRERYEARLKRISDSNADLDQKRQEDTAPSLAPQGYAGEYSDPMYGGLRISVEGDRLYLEMLPSPTFKGALEHWHFNTFKIEWEEIILPRGFVTFNLDMHGNVRDVTVDVPNFPDLLFSELLFKP